MNEPRLDNLDPCLLGRQGNGLRVTMPIGVYCPMRCKHCYQQGTAKYSIDLATNVHSLIRMGEAGVTKLYWDGTEPTTNPDIPLYLNAISHMKQKKPDVFERVSIATNGIYVTEEKAEEFFSLGLKNIMVSLDGIKGTHDSFRQPGAYDSAIKAMRILVNAGYDVRVGTTIWSGSIKELDCIAKTASDLGAKEVALNWMQPVGSALDHKELLIANENYQSVCDMIERVISDNPRIMINFHRGRSVDSSKQCRGGSLISYISGEYVWPCSWISTVAPEFRSEMTLKNHGLQDILDNDPVLNKFKDLSRKMNSEGGFCPALCKIYNGDFKGPDPLSESGIHRINQKPI